MGELYGAISTRNFNKAYEYLDDDDQLNFQDPSRHSVLDIDCWFNAPLDLVMKIVEKAPHLLSRVRIKYAFQYADVTIIEFLLKQSENTYKESSLLDYTLERRDFRVVLLLIRLGCVKVDNFIKRYWYDKALQSFLKAYKVIIILLVHSNEEKSLWLHIPCVIICEIWKMIGVQPEIKLLNEREGSTREHNKFMGGIESMYRKHVDFSAFTEKIIKNVN